MTTPIVMAYLAASILAFIAYWKDKVAAKRGRARIKESSLHLLSLVGGWPGALAAQQVLRHKTSKLSFQFLFWLTVILNVGAITWLFAVRSH